MNITSTISVAIGGLLLVAIMNMNNNVMQSSSSVTFEQSSNIYSRAISNVISNDLRKVGYGTSNPSAALISATSNSITFAGDIDNDGVVDTVAWKYDTSSPVTSSSNPNDYELTRTVNGTTTTMDLGVTKFNITLYDGSGNIVTNVASAKNIKVELICESQESMNGNYFPTSWQKVFAPVTLN